MFVTGRAGRGCVRAAVPAQVPDDPVTHGLEIRPFILDLRDIDVFVAGGTEGSERLVVVLNGQLRPYCIKACISEGWTVSYVIGDDGQVQLDGLGFPKTIRETGVVSLRRE